MDGFDFGAPAATEEAPAPLDGGFDFGAPAAPAAVAPMDALAGFDMGATPAAAEGFDMGAAAEAAPAMGAMDAMAGFAPEEIPDEPAAEPAFTMNSFNPKLAEIEEKTQKDRQDRTNAASMKESEMKMEASAALEKFHADRKAAAAAKKEANLCVSLAAFPRRPPQHARCSRCSR